MPDLVEDKLVRNINQAARDFTAIRNALKGKNLSVKNKTTSDYADLIDSLDTRNIQPFQEWMMYGGIDFTNYSSITELSELLNSNLYEETLLNTEASAAYAAYLNSDIATAIKGNPTYLRKALTSGYNYMFFNSSANFDEHIDNVIEKNEPIVASNVDVWSSNKIYNKNDFVIYQKKLYCCTEHNQFGSWVESNWKELMAFSADRCSDPVSDGIDDNGYYGYNAFNGGKDTDNYDKIYEQRGIWSAFGKDQWVQYKYDEQKYLCYVKIYNLRDNAPTEVTIEGSNDGENFTQIKKESLNRTIGINEHTDVMCHCTSPYQYYRFTFAGSVYDEELCCVGEIEIYTYK